MIKLGRNLSCSYYINLTSKIHSSTHATSESSLEFHREERDGKTHVTSLNIQTNERAIVQLQNESQTKRSQKFKKEYVLPDDATRGLKNVLVSCSQPVKQLQSEADCMADMLSQRRFPASPNEVRSARDQIRKKLQSEQRDSFHEDGVLGEKILEAMEYQIQHKVQRLLKKTRYNWKPLEFDSYDVAARYALARLAPNYAEVSRVLEELKATEFAPETVLDFGSGCGSGFWAVNERFPSLKEYCLVDISDEMTKLAMDIMRRSDGSLISKKVSFRRHLLPSLQNNYDLVICHRTLCEIGSPESRRQIIESLWRRTNKYLVLIESSLEDSFNALLDVRDYLLTSGVQIIQNELLQICKEKQLLTKDIEDILHNLQLSDFEKYSILREKLPTIDIPTVLPHASIFAPCPHDLGCPMQQKSSCSFPIRWRTLRADGKQKSHTRDGTETGKMSFMIIEKGSRDIDNNLPRILKMRKMNGHVTCDVCTAFKGLQRFTLSKKGGEMYKKLRMKGDGEISPFHMETKATEGVFDLYDQVVRN
ncbi:unnamed protein product [Auanema sp. JU1783]|nr:unnamed protein product [Auanema sp. JU1783]